MIAHLACPRLIGERFKENLSLHFKKKDLIKIHDDFNKWYEQSDSIPNKYKDGIKQEAEDEFKLFRKLLKIDD